MTLATNRNLLLSVVVLTGLATLVTFVTFLRESANARHLAALASRTEALEAERLPGLQAELATVGSALRALEERIAAAAQRDELAGVRTAVERQAGRGTLLDADVARLMEELSELRHRWEGLTQGLLMLEAASRRLDHRVTKLETPKADPPPPPGDGGEANGSSDH